MFVRYTIESIEDDEKRQTMTKFSRSSSSSSSSSTAAASGLFRLLIFVGIAAILVNFFVTFGNFYPQRKTSDAERFYLQSLENEVRSLRRKVDALADLKDPNATSVPAPGLSANNHHDGCKPKSKIAFAKTHKTGSSTFQNILFRFGVHNDLTFALPHNSWMFPFKEDFSASFVLDGPWKSLGFDIFAFHSIWNYAEMKKVLPDAVYVTLLRDPIDAFESNYVYMGLEKAFKMNINEFAAKRTLSDPPRRPNAIIGKDQLLWDLGLPAKDLEDVAKVKAKIDAADKEFDLVMIVEKFDASLVALQELLCWPTQDLTYLKLNERITEKKTNITEDTRRLLRKWLWADYLLYDHFRDKFDRRIKDIEDFAGKKSALEKANAAVRERCVIEKADNDKLSGEFRMALNIVYGYIIDEDDPDCVLYARSEPNFAKQLRDYQTLKVNAKKLRGDKKS